MRFKELQLDIDEKESFDSLLKKLEIIKSDLEKHYKNSEIQVIVDKSTILLYIPVKNKGKIEISKATFDLFNNRKNNTTNVI